MKLYRKHLKAHETGLPHDWTVRVFYRMATGKFEIYGRYGDREYRHDSEPDDLEAANQWAEDIVNDIKRGEWNRWWIPVNRG